MIMFKNNSQQESVQYLILELFEYDHIQQKHTVVLNTILFLNMVIFKNKLTTGNLNASGRHVGVRPGRDVAHGYFFSLLHGAWDGGEPRRARGAWTQIVLQSGDASATAKERRGAKRACSGPGEDGS